jgi:hypothetical protein
MGRSNPHLIPVNSIGFSPNTHHSDKKKRLQPLSLLLLFRGASSKAWQLKSKKEEEK